MRDGLLTLTLSLLTCLTPCPCTYPPWLNCCGGAGEAPNCDDAPLTCREEVLLRNGLRDPPPPEECIEEYVAGIVALLFAAIAFSAPYGLFDGAGDKGCCGRYCACVCPSSVGGSGIEARGYCCCCCGAGWPNRAIMSVLVYLPVCCDCSVC